MPDTEINEIFNLLALAGIQAELCDTLVPVSSCSVRCGKPTMVGEDGVTVLGEDEELCLFSWEKSLANDFSERKFAKHLHN